VFNAKLAVSLPEGAASMRELEWLSSDVSEKRRLLERAVELINSLGVVFENGDADTRSRLLGSIFPEMLEFDGEKCRTASINQALLLCLSIDKGSGPTKNRTLPEKLVVSGRVEGRSGLQLLHCGNGNV
jgi:hypothetical protein